MITENIGTVADVAQVASEAVETDWGYILMVAGVGFSLVLAVLLLLIFIMKLFGKVFQIHKEKAPESKIHYNDELAAAIITALKLYKSVIHDRESEMLTINRIARTYSPWNSKIHGLTSMPEHKK